MTTPAELRDLHAAQRELVKAYGRVFATEDGRLVLKDLKDAAFLTPGRGIVPAETGPVDAHRVMLRVGAQALVMSILYHMDLANSIDLEGPQTHAITQGVHHG
jgi:hypothetical protein